MLICHDSRLTKLKPYHYYLEAHNVQSPVACEFIISCLPHLIQANYYWWSLGISNSIQYIELLKIYLEYSNNINENNINNNNWKQELVSRYLLCCCYNNLATTNNSLLPLHHRCNAIILVDCSKKNYQLFYWYIRSIVYLTTNTKKHVARWYKREPKCSIHYYYYYYYYYYYHYYYYNNNNNNNDNKYICWY